ncbi:MAG: mannose-6-phosphate isomerase [Ruminococcaceae bacterium]|nr:mannose-6-phosphate isomerase [Oscillospiraceae bacterium]
MDLQRPIRLARAGAWRTYTGGSLIEALHGNVGAPDSSFPEEWMMSVVAARNAGREHIVEGLSMVEGTDISLKSLIEAHPEECLGAAHVKAHCATPGVLVKLLDAAERLTIQVHPTREKAMELFGSPFGKTECWHIIGKREIGGEKPCIYFGFKKGITRERWQDIFHRQDIPAMLNCLHKFEVNIGDTFLIEGGIPHAIGAGCFLVEIQEPTDLTIRTERVTPSGLSVADKMCHQGLGFDGMFDCFDYTGYSREETLARWKIKKSGRTLVGYDNTEMFRLDELLLDGSETVRADGTFSGIYVLEGEGSVAGEPVAAGAQFFIPAVCKPFEIAGKMRLIRYFGPKGE